MSSLLAVVFGFVSGVLLRSFFILGWEWVMFLILLATFSGIAFFVRPRLFYGVLCLCFVCCSIGIARVSFAEQRPPPDFANMLGSRVSYTGVVVTDPDVRDTNQRVLIRVTRGKDTTTILTIAPRYPNVSAGDQVYVSGTLEVPTPFAEENGRVFHYDKYLEREGVYFLLNFAYLRVQESAPWYSPRAALARVKHFFLTGLSNALPEPYASLAGGIVIGGKSGLGTELQDAFVRSGLVQIIVLSGYNVMIVAEWIMALFALTTWPRRWAAVAGVTAIVLFVGIAGASATAVRAMIMAFIALYARATGRTYNAGRALLLAIMLMLFWNPLYLAFDPGFGLSVVATAGLIWLAPLIANNLTAVKNIFWRNAVATTLAAQIAVLPLLLYDTGTLSLVSIPANLLVLPIVPLTMGLSAVAGVMGMILKSIAPVMNMLVAFPAYLTNAYLIFIARGAARLPFAAFSLPSFPFWLVLVSYGGLIYLLISKRFSTTAQFTFAKKASI